MKIGANAFGLRTEFSSGYESAVDRLKDIGIDSLEVCIKFPTEEFSDETLPQGEEARYAGIWETDEAARKIAYARSKGLNVVSVHFMVSRYKGPKDGDMLISILPGLIDFAKENGIKYYVVSPMATSDAIRPFIDAIKIMSDKMAENGITLLLHNHIYEFIKDGGESAMDILLRECPNLCLEFDVGWSRFIKNDPVRFIKDNAPRIKLIHFKDLLDKLSDMEHIEECTVAVGTGDLELKEIIEALRDCDIIENGYIIDQDLSDDIMRDLKIGAENIRRL